MRKGLWALGFGLWAACAVTLTAQSAQTAQAPPQVQPMMQPVESVTLDEAVARALKNNPTIASASQAILRAEGLLQQARSAILPSVSAAVSNVLVNTARAFGDIVTQPRDQVTVSGNLSMPVLAASRWAAASQARDQIEVANLSTADIRRQIGVATAQTYLSIITQRRQVELSIRALETARAHLDYSNRRLESGAGTRLNQLRAAQEVSTDEARVEVARLAVLRAQEALGVLMAANGPVDASAEPAFDLPAAAIDEAAWMQARTDLRLQTATRRAFERVWRDSSKDYLPTGIASFDPSGVHPAGVFAPAGSWRLTVSFSQPIFDGGQRRGLRRVREAAFRTADLTLAATQIQARSEVRLAQEVVRSSERSLTSLRLSAQQAEDVVNITNIAFEAGATTNLEVIDAQRSARDAEAAAEIAADALRRARLDLLTALGRFPQ
jgi:outer membrane protein TolC